MVSFNLNPRNNQLPCEPKVSTWLLYILLNNLSPRLRRCSCLRVVCSSLKPCSGTDLAGVDLKRTEKPETAWQDKPGKSRTVIGGGGGGVFDNYCIHFFNFVVCKHLQETFVLFVRLCATALQRQKHVHGTRACFSMVS